MSSISQSSTSSIGWTIEFAVVRRPGDTTQGFGSSNGASQLAPQCPALLTRLTEIRHRRGWLPADPLHKTAGRRPKATHFCYLPFTAPRNTICRNRSLRCAPELRQP